MLAHSIGTFLLHFDALINKMDEMNEIGRMCHYTCVLIPSAEALHTQSAFNCSHASKSII